MPAEWMRERSFLDGLNYHYSRTKGHAERQNLVVEDAGVIILEERLFSICS